MSALDEIKKNLGTATVAPLDKDLNRKGTTQPVTNPKPAGSALDAIRSNLNAPPTVAPATPPSEKKGFFGTIKSGYDAYANQVERKVASFDAGFISSVGQLARSFQWLGDRLVGDRIMQNSSDKLLEAELKQQDDMLKIYRDRKAKGDTEGAKKILDILNKSGFTPYQAYADTTDSVFYKAQDKTQQWADVLKKSAGITPENSTFSDRLFEGAGSSATYFIPSLGVAKGASVLATVSPRIAMLFGGSAGASLEAMAEAGQTFDEWKKKGDLQKAGEESTKTFLANAILLAVTNHLGVFNPAKLGVLKRALLSAPVEGLQEGVQQIIQNQNTGRPLWEGVLESGAIGAIVGTVMGGATDIITTEPDVRGGAGDKQGKEGTKTTPDSVSPALSTLRDTLKVTPAIEAQKAIEQRSEPLPSPTVTEVAKTGTESLPEGKGSGLEAKVDLSRTAEIPVLQEVRNIASKFKTFEGFVNSLEKKIDSISKEKPLETFLQENGFTDLKDFYNAVRNDRELSQSVLKKSFEKQVADYKAEDIFLNEKDNPKLTTVSAERFGQNGDILPSQLTVDRSGVEKYKKQILAGERPFVLVGTNTQNPSELRVKDGHTRLQAYTELGFKEIPVIDNTEGKLGGKEVVTKKEDKTQKKEKPQEKGKKKAEAKKETKKYPTIHEGGKIKVVEGEPIEIVKGVETFLHKGTGGWVVSEASTGRYLADGKTKEEAIVKAKANIESVGKKKFLELLKNNKLDVSRETPSGTKNASVGEFRDDSKPYKTTYNVNDQIDFDTLTRTFNEETANKMKDGVFEYGRYKTKAEIEKLIRANIVDEPFTPEKLKESKYTGTRTFYHGTIPENVAKIEKEGFKIGSSLPEEAFRAGGYGRMQDSVSLSADPETASIFTGSSPIGAVIKTQIDPEAKIISVSNIEDATDLNDYVPELLDRGVDAVWIGGGEKELIVLNPEVIKVIDSRTFKVTNAKAELAGFASEQPQSASPNASVGRYRDDTELFLGNPDAIKPIQFPELVGLAKELSGNTPFLRKYQKSNGMFYGKGTGEIGLNPELFKRENLGQLTKTLAHEIGHLVDYLPDQTLSRGNLMGRLNTLKDFRKEFFAPAGVTRTDTELREQMYELSKYWRPYEEETASASFKSYRKSATEIYADFISALFNDPRLVSNMAPTAYNVFFQQLDNKPAVKQAYFELQDLLRNGDLVASRRSATTEMFKVTEQESRERQIQNEIEQEAKEKSVWFKFKTQAVDITEAIKEKVKEAEKAGKKINDDDNPTYYLEERNYLGGKIKSEVDTKFNSIYQELQKDGMTWEDLGELMFYERVLKGDRQEIANPLGYQPDFVAELMEVYDDVGTVKPDQQAHEKGTSDMKTTLGEDKFRKLQALAVEYRENLKGFFEQGREEGIYSEELAKMFDENAFYVPFKGAKYSGVTKTTFGVKQQKGTLGNIENPANTGIEKAVSIIRAIERNKVTRKTLSFLQENFAEEVTEAKTDKNGYPIEPREQDLALVTYMEDGKVKGYYVDKYIGDAIKKNTVAESNLLIGGLRFMNSRLFRPLFITFNLGFQSFNAIRDFKRFWKNIPNMTILKAMRLYAKSARASKIRAFGLPKNPSAKDLEAHELINNLEKEQVLSITYNDIIKGEAIEDAQIDRILREVGVRETEQTKLGELASRVGLTKKSPIIKQAFQIMDFIEKTGNMIESMPKIAGIHALQEKMPPREMRSFVRKYVGSPDFMAGGKFKPYMNEVFLFSNAIFQGIRSDYEIATQPKTRGGFWLKTAQAEIVPKILMLMASAGLFGEWLKELFAKIGDYDKTNYTTIPLGIDENGKAVYFRLPSDETGRLIGGAFWKIANAVRDPQELADMETYTDLLAYAGGQVPSFSPVITTGMNITQFLGGNNPYDFFRGRPVLTDEQMQAGGMEKTKPFLTYLFQQMGGNVFMKLYQNETVPKNPSLSENIANLPVVGNIAGRFIKASDYGETEKLREITGEVRSENARENIENRRTVFDYVERSQGMSYPEAQALKREMIKEIYDGAFPKTPEERTQARNLEKRFDTLRVRGTADTRVDALMTAQSNEEKVALLKEYQKTMPADKFAELKRFIITNKVVSSAVFQAFNRVEK